MNIESHWTHICASNCFVKKENENHFVTSCCVANKGKRKENLTTPLFFDSYLKTSDLLTVINTDKTTKHYHRALIFSELKKLISLDMTYI